VPEAANGSCGRLAQKGVEFSEASRLGLGRANIGQVTQRRGPRLRRLRGHPRRDGL